MLLLNYLGSNLLLATRQHLSGYAVQSIGMADKAKKSGPGLIILLTARLSLRQSVQLVSAFYELDIRI